MPSIENVSLPSLNPYTNACVVALLLRERANDEDHEEQIDGIIEYLVEVESGNVGHVDFMRMVIQASKTLD